AEDLGRACRDGGAGTDIVLVVDADPRSGTPFDDDLMAVVDELAHAPGYEPDPVLMGFDFLRDADAHSSPPVATDLIIAPVSLGGSPWRLAPQPEIFSECRWHRSQQAIVILPILPTSP